ncbi:DUF1684 domain-containing protein [Cellulophaga sp. E16_2]|uniref:DUF1684 domain-containing protein n=1 Tax=Cellulophaga algicola (strain DSM 14237 / IC166 / ACAM 630) TaxID=688270 RepID=E6XA40_CELAD|nr:MULTISPECIES: DUF1684 domain-containing protein [Cellulophaga]ADV47730.1 protein of unknown function DUF1684 [Cellulophaga algicola DSM 14237]MBO0590092.1 DUF1684 domain-containing protein [Cellulophaga sp. E16_2]
MRKLLFLAVILLLSCKQEKKYHDVVANEIPQDVSNAMADILKFQRELNKEYKDPETSPLYNKDRKNFETLDFFKPDTTLRVVAKFERTPDALPFLMATTTDRKSEEVVYGIAYFAIDGKDYQLEVYQSPSLTVQEKFREYLFLPFSDETNGNLSYTGGRYVDLSIPKGDTIVIDFNKAYNPYCAYNKKYSCPIVPKVNYLPIKINAGVMAFKKQ